MAVQIRRRRTVRREVKEKIADWGWGGCVRVRGGERTMEVRM